MTIAEMGIVIGLALADSTSLGTLLVLIWMLTSPRAELRGVALYLSVLAGFYWLAGLTLTFSLDHLTALFEGLSETSSWTWTQLGAGAVILAGGLVVDRRSSRGGARSTRLHRWRAQTLRPTTTRGLVGLALAAGVLELASMLPFLAAIWIVTQTGLQPVQTSGVLAGYVAIMTLPAVLLLAVRFLARDHITPYLERMERWLDRHTGAMLATVLVVVGAFLAADAAMRLELVPT